MAERNAKDQVLSFLFDREGFELCNIKLFKGDKPNLSEDDIYSAMHNAFTQERMGKACVSSEYADNRRVIDAQAFVASL